MTGDAAALICASAGAAGASAATLAWAVRARSASVFGASVWRGPRDGRAVALTFDDGPSEATPEILEILARHNARATFFQLGANVDRLAAVAQQVAAAGHELGNHSYSHPLLCFKPPGFILDEFRRAQEAVERHAGVRPRWLRAPFGARWPGLGSAQAALGLTGVMWTVIGRDWRLPAAGVVRRVLAGSCNGAVICLHDGREATARPDVSATVAALREIAPRLADQGYQFRTVTELFGA